MGSGPGPFLLLDGGLGTSLEDKYGVVFDKATSLWSSHLLLSNPESDVLLRCQADFGRIPVDILLTATYQVSTEGFYNTRSDEFPEGVDEESQRALVRLALDIADKAASHKSTRIALSLGPYGACMVPSQEYSGMYDENHDSEAKLREWHRDKLGLFRAAGAMDGARVQFVAFETIPRVDEIVAVRKALLDSELVGAGIPSPTFKFWMSCVFPGEASNLPDGSSVNQVIEAMLDPDVAAAGSVPWGVGINCTKIGRLRDLVRRYEAAVVRLENAGKLGTWPALLLYPDGTDGQVYDTETRKWVVDSSPSMNVSVSWEDQLAAIARETHAHGKWRQIVVGGCCKADAESITRLGKCLGLGEGKGDGEE